MADIILGGTVAPGGPFEQARQDNIKGGDHSVVDVTARNALPDYLRQDGMLVWVRSTTTPYRLVGGIGNGNWATVNVTTPNVDTEGATTLSIGVTNASAVAIGKVGATTTINGNLTVSGTTTHVNSTTTDFADRLLQVNTAAGPNAPVPTQICGVNVQRGDIASVLRDGAGWLWDETASLWKAAFQTASDDTTLGNYIGVAVDSLMFGSGTGTKPTLTSGSGAPVSTPSNGSLYARTDGTPTGADALYIRASGSWNGLLPNGITAGGDLMGTLPSPSVVNLTLGSDAQGDLYYRGASALARLPAGTSGKFLKTLGAGANPLWSDVDKLVSAGVITITSVGSVDWNAVISTLPIDTVSAPATIFTVATLTIPTSSARAYAARIQVRDTSGVGYYYGELRDSFQRAGGVPAREGAVPAIVGEIKTGTLASCTFAFSVSGNDILLTVTTGIAASRISGTCEALL